CASQIIRKASRPHCARPDCSSIRRGANVRQCARMEPISVPEGFVSVSISRGVLTVTRATCRPVSVCHLVLGRRVTHGFVCPCVLRVMFATFLCRHSVVHN